MFIDCILPEIVHAEILEKFNFSNRIKAVRVSTGGNKIPKYKVSDFIKGIFDNSTELNCEIHIVHFK